MISVWNQDEQTKVLAQVIQSDRKFVKRQISIILSHKRKSEHRKYDEARTFLMKHALAGLDFDPCIKHFVLFKKRETVEIIIEDRFDLDEVGKIVMEHQEDLSKVFIQCVYISKNDAFSFLTFLFSDAEQQGNVDKISRYRTLFWFVCLIIDILTIDSMACKNGFTYIREKLNELLDRVENQQIINQNGETEKDDYDNGIWNYSLFGFLQGEDRKEFVGKLKEQFNFDNKTIHSNRYLLSKNRDCVCKQTYEIFCQ